MVFVPKIVRQELRNANKVFEGITQTQREHSTPWMHRSLQRCSMGNFIHEGKKRGCSGFTAAFHKNCSWPPSNVSVRGCAAGLLALVMLRMEGAK